MKILVSFKDPDALHDAVVDAVKTEVNKLTGLAEEEGQDLIDSRVEKMLDLMGMFFEWGEYVLIEVDTDAKTARVVSVKEQK